MSYAYVEEGQIKKMTDVIPKNWKNISGLDLSANDDQFLNSVGWYRVVRTNVDFDEETQRVDSYEYIIESNYVAEIPQIVNKPESEIVTFEMKKQAFMTDLRSMRDILLKDSDWTQFPDVIEIKSEEFTLQWKQYRQNLRDITEEYNDNNVVNVQSVEWPAIPEIVD